MEKTRGNNFKAGLLDGTPIGLGYLSVSIAFGVQAVVSGIPVFIAVLISATNLTSAGQLAGIEVIARSGTLLEIVLTQLVINARYFLMSMTLSQKFDDDFPVRDRLLAAAGVTDEVFVVSVTGRPTVKRSYFFGLLLFPYVFWVAGTLIGGLVGLVLPEKIRFSLGIALYAMFIAIIVPPSKRERGILFTVLLSAAISCLFYYLPFFSQHVSSSIAVIVASITATAVISWLFPIKEAQ